MPDSSIGEGMDISIQGANGHVKHNNDTASLRSHDSVAQPQPRSNLDLLAPPDPDDKFTYSDMSIGLGMDISIRGEGDLNETKESYDEHGWRVGGEGGPGVNFTNVLREAFMCADPESAKIQSSSQFFCALRILGRKSCS